MVVSSQPPLFYASNMPNRPPCDNPSKTAISRRNSAGANRPIRQFVQFLHRRNHIGATLNYAVETPDFVPGPGGLLFSASRAAFVQQTVFLQFVLQRTTTDAQRFSRLRAVLGHVR